MILPTLELSQGEREKGGTEPFCMPMGAEVAVGETVTGSVEEHHAFLWTTKAVFE